MSAPPRSGLRHVFVGSAGLRAGCSVLLFSVLVVALSLSAFIIHRTLPRRTTAFDA